MSNVSEKDLKAYFHEAASWETNRLIQAERSKRTAWRIATGSFIAAVALALAVAGLTPLKKVEPYVIRVDNATGVVDVVEALTDGKTNYDEAVNKYFIQWYIRYREGYSRALSEEYYYATGLMSGTVEQQRYLQFFNPKNPLSPLNVYGDYAKVKISIKSTSFINSNVALVRYTKEIERGADRPQITHWAATVTFRYTKAPMSEKDRGINPLGLQVTEYRNDPDALAPAATAPAPAAAPAFEPAPSVQAFPATAPAVPAIQQ